MFPFLYVGLCLFPLIVYISSSCHYVLWAQFEKYDLTLKYMLAVCMWWCMSWSVFFAMYAELAAVFLYDFDVRIITEFVPVSLWLYVRLDQILILFRSLLSTFKLVPCLIIATWCQSQSIPLKSDLFLYGYLLANTEHSYLPSLFWYVGVLLLLNVSYELLLRVSISFYWLHPKLSSHHFELSCLTPGSNFLEKSKLVSVSQIKW